MKNYGKIFLLGIAMSLSVSAVSAADFLPELSTPAMESALFNNAGLSDNDKQKIKQNGDDVTFFETNKDTTRQSIQEDLNETDENISDIEDDVLNEEPVQKKKWFNFKKPDFKSFITSKNNKNIKPVQANETESDITLDADFLDYFPDKSEIVAVGNAKVFLPKENLSLYANKIVFNHDTNIIKAYDNVRLISAGAETTGDFITFNLSQDDGFVENPFTTTYDIQVKAKEGRIFSDKLEEYNGVAKIIRNYDMIFGARSFASYINNSQLNLYDRVPHAPDQGIYHLKSQEIHITAKEDHNLVTMTNTAVYAKKIKLGIVPNLNIVSNKQQTAFDTNIPEFGSTSNMGMYIGPAIVLNTPKASTLKVAPLLTYSDGKFGIGAFARFMHAKNKTDFMYGSSEDKFLLSGRQSLTDRLSLNYSQNTYQDEWFLGYRQPRYSMDLQYNRADFVKDLGLTFAQRYSAGYFVDSDDQIGQGEMRFRWMTQTQKSFFRHVNKDKNILVDFGLVAQTAASVYSKGEVTGVVRGGPVLTTMVGPWKQSIIYYQTGQAGKSPFAFDEYAYGKSNLVFVEELKICKYLSIGYLASLALLKDGSTGDLWEENRFLVSVGPDYAKVTLGYDAYRQSTMFMVSMLVGTKGTQIDFDKAVYKKDDSQDKQRFMDMIRRL